MVYGTHRGYVSPGDAKDSRGAACSFRDLDLAVETTCRSLKDHVTTFATSLS